MNGARHQEAKHSHRRAMASATVRVPAEQSMCGTLAACLQAAAGRLVHARAERFAEWGYRHHAKADGLSRVVKQIESRCCRARVGGARTIDADPAGLKARLQFVRMQLVPARLRHAKAGRGAEQLSHVGLDVRRRAGKSTDSGIAGSVAARSKNENAIPATGRSTYRTSRHGTNSHQGKPLNPHFVPPRDETPCFRQ